MRPLRASEIRGTWATLLLPVDASDGIDYSRLADETRKVNLDGLTLFSRQQQTGRLGASSPTRTGRSRRRHKLPSTVQGLMNCVDTPLRSVPVGSGQALGVSLSAPGKNASGPLQAFLEHV